MYVVTGGAGFIGSNIVAAIADRGGDVVVIDWLGHDDLKWRNIAKRRLIDIIEPENGADFLRAERGSIVGIVHMGAISTTTETDIDKIVRYNFRLSIDIWQYCSHEKIPLVYASSAATYGDGARGFVDRLDDEYLSALRPLNAYGWSKILFDRWVSRVLERGQSTPPRWAGLKFFNVYGPNEYHKGGQRSVVAQLHEQIRSNGVVRLFKSDNSSYVDGRQQRDFVWVGDCAEIALWALTDSSAPSGLYNVGSGTARSFIDIADIHFKTLGLPPKVEFIDLPQELRGKYQYYTCAEMTRLREAGYAKPLTSLEEGLGRYLGYLEASDRFR